MNYIIGRNNFALTIFIPVDCKNNCPFCTSKGDYREHKPSLTGIFDSLNRLQDAGAVFNDIVITGGEPFADLSILSKLLVQVACTIKFKNLFINTTLPSQHLSDTIDFINNSNIISGVSVSRHLNFDFTEIAGVEDLKKINKSVRINCVLPNTVHEDKIKEFAAKYKDFIINFRADYRTIGAEELHSLTDISFQRLDNLFGYTGVSTSCHVCHTDIFNGIGDFNIQYHRGFEQSSLIFANYIEINDLIIKQDGLLCYDWLRHRKVTDDVLNSIFVKETNMNIDEKQLELIIKRVVKEVLNKEDKGKEKYKNSKIIKMCHYVPHRDTGNSIISCGAMENPRVPIDYGYSGYWRGGCGSGGC